jgi:translation initiation factor IF-3
MAKQFGSGRYRGRGREERVRKNERIRAREVRLISPDGKQIGVVSRDEALKAAKAVGLDLVEISANSNPPICRVLDFGKYMYEQSKRQKENKSRAASSTKVKEVKFRVRIEEHDYMTKLRRGEEFLFKGNKLKVSLMFRGREMEHKELGMAVVKRAAADLAHVGSIDSEPKLSGRHINLLLSPLPITKRKLKLNEKLSDREEHDDDHDDDDEEDEDEDEDTHS